MISAENHNHLNGQFHETSSWGTLFLNARCFGVFLTLNIYPSHAKHIIMVIVWSPCESSLEECHIEQTTVEAEELEEVVFECQGIIKILLSSGNKTKY